jgi:hypothetical protein
MFKSNSSEVDLSNMREVDKEKIKKYSYEYGKLTIEYIIDRKVKGREVILFDNGERPTKDTFLDQDGNSAQTDHCFSRQIDHQKLTHNLML